MSETQTTPAQPAATAQPAPAAPPAQPAPTATPAQPAPTAPAASWYSSAGFDEDTVGWLQNRGYDKLDAPGAAAAAVKQARELEKLRGVPMDRLLQLPSDPSQPGAMDDIYARLGRPASAAEYKFNFSPDTQEGEQEVASALAPAFHAAGLSQDAAAKVFDAVKQFSLQSSQQQEEAVQAERAAALESLKNELGDTYEMNVGIARATVAKLGVDKETVDALEDALGNAGVLKLFMKIGEKSSEAGYVSGTSHLGGVTTPEGARNRIEELKADPSFRERYLNNDAEASRIMRDLHVVANGGTVSPS